MEKEELQKNIALYYEKLPPEAQEVFSSMEWLKTLENISSKYALTQFQQETLVAETTLVLLGIIHPEEYEEILKKELSMPQTLLVEILTEIKGSVLESIRPQLTDAFTKNISGEETGEVIDGELDDRFKRLPKNIQDAIGESNYQNALYEISRKFQFTIEQMGLLEESVVDVMLGKISSDEFKKSIKNTLRLTNGEVEELVNSINNKILIRIKGKIMEPNTPPPQIKSEEMDILNQAGIKIMEPDLSVLELTTPKKVEALSNIPTKPTNPIFGQKFSSTVQIPVVKTEHRNPSVAPNQITPETQKSYPKGGDPYRLAPEE